MKKKVAVVGGGYSAEREISLKSIETVLAHLDTEKYDLYKVLISKEGWHLYVDEERLQIDQADFSVNYKGKRLTFDFAFITVHGTPGEDGLLQAYFDLLSIPYSTPAHIPSTITFDKWANNNLLRSLGFNCAKSVILRDAQYDEEMILKKVGLPCFVKPNDGGSSFGVSRVTEKSQLGKAIKGAFEHGRQVIIESEMKGREVTCGVFTNKGEVVVLPITEIISENDFFDYAAKYEGKSQEITPAQLPDHITNAVQSTTGEIYKVMGLKGMARIDYIIVGEVPHVIEINTTPGLSPQSIIPQQAREAGISLKELFGAVVEQSIGEN